MRNHDLGPKTRTILGKFNDLSGNPELDYTELALVTFKMSQLLQRWMDMAWCWVDAAPARICGGPHVRVIYAQGSPDNPKQPLEVIEPFNHVGETFPDVPFTIG